METGRRNSLFRAIVEWLDGLVRSAKDFEDAMEETRKSAGVEALPKWGIHPESIRLAKNNPYTPREIDAARRRLFYGEKCPESKVMPVLQIAVIRAQEE